MMGCTAVVWATPGEGEAGKQGDVAVEVGGGQVEVSEWEVIPEVYLKAYVEKKPDGYLIDPQRVLSPVVKRDRAAFLEYYAGDSRIDLYVYLLGGKQAVPDVVQRDEVMRRHFSGGKPAAVLWYPFGDPARAELHLSSSVRERVADAEGRRAIASSIMQAVEKSDPGGQLEAFLVQMSIRMYWLERMMGGEVPVPPSEVKVVAVEAARAEVRQPAAEWAGRWEMVREVVRDRLLEVVGTGVVVMLLGIWVVWARVRARHVLPDFSVEPRLGGDHGAGVGAVISFASASVPPGLQRGGLE